MATFKLSMSIIYRIFLIKRHPRIKATYKRKIINKRGTQSEQCGVYLRIIRKGLVQLRNLHNLDNDDYISAKKTNKQTKRVIGTLINILLYYVNRRMCIRVPMNDSFAVWGSFAVLYRPSWL